MAMHKVLYVKRDDFNNATEVCIFYEGLEICYTPVHYFKDGKEIKGVKECSRVCIFEGEYTTEKMKIRVKSDEKAIRDKAWAIIYKNNKKAVIKKFYIPNEDKMVEEASLLNSELIALKSINPNKTFTEILGNILKNKALPLRINFSDTHSLSYYQRKMFFDLYKVGLNISHEGWIIIKRMEGKNSFKSVVFNIDSAIRMQDHILESYIGGANIIVGEISKINELMELSRKINNLLIDWENSKKNKANLKIKINSLIDELSSYRNQLKRDSKKLLETFSSLTDSRGRENPGAFATKTIAILNRLEARLAQIRDISPIIEKRKKILNGAKKFLETEKARAENDLKEIINMSNFAVLSATKVNEIKINMVIHIIDSLAIGVFASKRMQAVFFLQTAKGCILQTKKAKKYLREALAILQS